MTRTIAFTILFALPALPQGAVPKGASAYQPIEVSNVRWVSPPTEKEPAIFRRGNLWIDGDEGVTFTTVDGEELRVSYRSITAMQYGVVARPPRPAKRPKAAKAPIAAPATPVAECTVPENKPKERSRLTSWMPKKMKLKAPPMPSLTPSLPVGSLQLLTITHRRGERSIQTFLELGRDNRVYLLNALAGRSTVPVRKVGYRDPWTVRTTGAGAHADDE